jgi:hypothetical protein
VRPCLGCRLNAKPEVGCSLEHDAATGISAIAALVSAPEICPGTSYASDRAIGQSQSPADERGESPGRPTLRRFA